MNKQNRCSQEIFFSLWGNILSIGICFSLIILTLIILGIGVGLNKYWLHKADIFFLFWQIVLVVFDLLIAAQIKEIWFYKSEMAEENMTAWKKIVHSMILFAVCAGLQLANFYCGSMARNILLVIWFVFLVLSLLVSIFNVAADWKDQK